MTSAAKLGVLAKLGAEVVVMDGLDAALAGPAELQRGAHADTPPEDGGVHRLRLPDRHAARGGTSGVASDDAIGTFGC